MGAAPAPAVAAEPTPGPHPPDGRAGPRRPAARICRPRPRDHDPGTGGGDSGPQADDPVGRQRRPFSPSVEEEIAIVARRQEEESRIRRAEVAQLPGRPAPGAVPPPPSPAGMPDQPAAPVGDSAGLSGPTGVNASTRFELQRAPSPTEVIPIRRIPIPEEFVPLPPREFHAMRKYWTAPAVCHMPLYFQDAALERYGHSVENFFGTTGRYLSYPIDDPQPVEAAVPDPPSRPASRRA